MEKGGGIETADSSWVEGFNSAISLAPGLVLAAGLGTGLGLGRWGLGVG